MTTTDACRLLAEYVVALRDARARILELEGERHIEREIGHAALEQLAAMVADCDRLRQANRHLRDELRRQRAPVARERVA